MKFSTGSEFGRRYTLGDRIAVGGMGEVWRATDRVLGRTVAIKLLSASLADQPGFTQRFREEARNTAALGHGNIAAVYDYGEDGGASWLVMELVEGKPLSQIIKEEGPLDPRRTSAIVAQAASALQAAHDAGVIHRDVKPANILVRPDGHVKLTDFGIARAIDSAPITRTGEVMGTAQYISPEQAMGKQVGPASDIYGLGVVAHEMLTGERPFDEGSPVATAMAHIHNPPPPLPASTPDPPAGVVMACLAKDPSLRPSSARDVADALSGRPGAPSFGATERLPAAQRTERMVPPAAYPAATGTTSMRLGEHEPEESKRRNPLVWLVPLLLVLGLAAFGLSRLDPFGAPPTPGGTATPTTSTRPTATSTPQRTAPAVETVEISKSDYVGQSYAAVSSALRNLGLEPRRSDVASDEPAGRVVDLDPDGTVEQGSTVTVSVSRGPQTQEPAPTSTATTTTTTPPAEPTEPPTTESEPDADTGSNTSPAPDGDNGDSSGNNGGSGGSGGGTGDQGSAGNNAGGRDSVEPGDPEPAPTAPSDGAGATGGEMKPGRADQIDDADGSGTQETGQ